MKQITALVSALIFILSPLLSHAQEYSGGTPFLRNYSHEEYKGENQNFAVCQDNRGVMYFANNKAVLEFDGRSWRQIYMPDRETIYALGKDPNGRIYVGASKGQLGYLAADKAGQMKYRSLKDKLPDEHADFNLIRDIVFPKDGKILFISPLAIYTYNGKKFKVHTIKDSTDYNRYVFTFKINDEIFVQERGRGILQYTENGNFKQVPGTGIFEKIWVTGMFPADSDSILFTTWDGTNYALKNGNVTKRNLKNPLLHNIYKNIKYQGNNYVLGLFNNGVVFTDNNLNIKKHINDEKGLQNNNIRALLADEAGNIWTGLNNGISVIYANSPYTVYEELYGLKSTTLTSLLYNGSLYIGNASGVFYTDWQGRDPMQKTAFKKVKGLGAFQVWYLDSIDGKLFGAGSSGIFTINEKNHTARFIIEDESTKSFIRLKYRPDIILGIGGNGLAKIRRNTEGKWGNYKKIKGFNRDFRNIKQTGRNEFWVSDRSKGLIKLTLSENLDSVETINEYGITDGLPDKLGNQAVEYRNQIIFITEEGIYNYNRENDIFIPDPFFADIWNESEAAVTDFLTDRSGNIWFKQRYDDPQNPNKSSWELGFIKETPDTAYVVKKPFYKVKNNIHSLYPLPKNKMLIGTEEGFVIYNNNYDRNARTPFNVLIRKLETIKNDSLIFGGTFSDTSGTALSKQNPKRMPVLPYEFRDVRISFAAPFFEEPERTVYKFILEGNDKEWSDWKTESMKEYSNLMPGRYTFRVKAKNMYGIESREAVYRFEILPPYYRTTVAYIIYVILFGLFIWGIVAFSTRRVKKQKENLERIVEERTKQIKAQNEELNKRNEEIKSKNKDITASINYAKRIQDAMLPLQSNIAQAFEDSFILFKPRDIVSGDFFWFDQKNGKIVITAVDCTGHGVPGAFMSLIGSEILASVVGQGILEPSKILKKMNRYVMAALKQEETANQDGMDLALCVIDPEKKTLGFSGAKNPLVYIENDEIHYIKGDRKGIGGYQEKGEFSQHTLSYTSPAYFYIFSDGFQDQFGGPKNRKFMIKRLRNLLLDIHKLPGEKQKEILNDTIEDWMSEQEQTDDILLIGFML